MFPEPFISPTKSCKGNKEKLEKSAKKYTISKQQQKESQSMLINHKFGRYSQKADACKQQIIAEIKRTSQEFISRAHSEKRILPPKYDVDLRKNKVHTATRVVHQTPKELLTRKLEWTGKETKKPIPFFYDTKSAKIFQTVKRKLPTYHKILQSLSGWEEEKDE